MHISTTNTANANQGPAYIGEISPKNTRGGFTAANQVIIESMFFQIEGSHFVLSQHQQ